MDIMAKWTTIVAGGAGFLGSHLCDFLLAEGHAVICVDNLITGDVDNINHLMSNPNFKYLKQDIVAPLIIEGHVDYILNFASPASPIDYLKHPIETMMVGSLGTLNMLELAREKKATFLMASTSEVYGDPLEHPQKEDYWGNVNPIGPRSVYDEAKRFSEALVMAYHRTYGMDTKIVRIFNTYGPRMRKDDGRAIPTLIMQALNNEPMTVFGDGSQTRSFCYVSDLITGIYRLMRSDTNLPVNLGNPNEMTLVELAKTIQQMIGNKNEIVYEPLPENDPKLRRPDITRAQKLLGWRPQISLQEGLKATIEWFENSKIYAENKRVG
jgi:dTDP-glucose 4,6-dehydratase